MLSAALVLTASMVVGQAADAPAGLKALRAYGKLTVGNWEGVVTLDADSPGLGKAGEKIKGTSTTKWLWDKAALQCNWEVGGLKGMSLAVAGTKPNEVRLVGVFSDGTTTDATITQVGDKWIAKVVWHMSDGQSRSHTETTTFADGGATEIHDFTDVVHRGQKLAESQDIWKKVNKQQRTK